MNYFGRTFCLGVLVAFVAMIFTLPVFAGQIEDSFKNVPVTGKPLGEQKVKELKGMKDTAGLALRSVQKQSPQSLVGQWKSQFIVYGDRGMELDDQVFFLYPDGKFENVQPSKKMVISGKWELANNQLVLSDTEGKIGLDLLLTENFMILNVPGSDIVYFLQFASNI